MRKKLDVARAQGYENNAKALEAVLPKDRTIDEVFFRLGFEWIPPDVVEDFVKKAMNLSEVSVKMVKVAAGEEGMTRWQVNSPSWRSSTENREAWGAEGKPGAALVEDCLNLTRTEIFDYITDDQGNEKRVKNPARSLVAQQKQKEIQTAFANWVLDNAKASTTLADIYNKTKNNYVVPQWREPKIDHFPNASHAVSLRAP